jgi:uncharacterized membrane protein YphA (DoxX/SURF4 family)
MNKLNIKIKSISESQILTTIFRLILGTVFLYASYDKILDPETFAISVQNYQIIPMSLSNLVAIILPWCEFYCALFLLVGWWHRAAAFIVSIMNIIFIVALSVASFRGLDINCGCFGTGTSVSIQRIIEDIILLAFSLYIFFKPRSKLAIENILG